MWSIRKSQHQRQVARSQTQPALQTLSTTASGRNIHRVFRQAKHEHLGQSLACGWKPAGPSAGGLVTPISDAANSSLLQYFRSRLSRADSSHDLHNHVRAALCLQAQHSLKARGWGKQLDLPETETHLPLPCWLYFPCWGEENAAMQTGYCSCLLSSLPFLTGIPHSANRAICQRQTCS